METKTRFTVDSQHCARAADELYAMLLRQDLSFVQRWDSNPASIAVVKIARAMGILAALLGIALTLGFGILGTPDWATPPDWAFLPVFVVGLVCFYQLPRIHALIHAWMRRFREKSCRRYAKRLVLAARQHAPFDAEYELKDDCLTYVRDKNGSRQLAWQRRLSKYKNRGLALQGTTVTAIFRRPTSFTPSVVILRDGSGWLASVLQDAGVPAVDIAQP